MTPPKERSKIAELGIFGIGIGLIGIALTYVVYATSLTPGAPKHIGRNWDITFLSMLIGLTPVFLGIACLISKNSIVVTLTWALMAFGCIVNGLAALLALATASDLGGMILVCGMIFNFVVASMVISTGRKAAKEALQIKNAKARKKNESARQEGRALWQVFKRLRAKSADSWEAYHALSNLGAWYLSQRQLEKSRSALEKAYSGLQRRAAKIPSDKRIEVLKKTVSRLIKLSKVERRSFEVKKWRAELLQIAELDITE